MDIAGDFDPTRHKNVFKLRFFVAYNNHIWDLMFLTKCDEFVGAYRLIIMISKKDVCKHMLTKDRPLFNISLPDR